jgi:hypothetical protein
MTSQRVVRGWGVNKTHVVNVSPDQLAVYTAFKSNFTGVALPVVAECGTRISGKVGVCMRAGTPVHCRPCTHITGVAKAPANNEEGAT